MKHQFLGTYMYAYGTGDDNRAIEFYVNENYNIYGKRICKGTGAWKDTNFIIHEDSMSAETTSMCIYTLTRAPKGALADSSPWDESKPAIYTQFKDLSLEFKTKIIKNAIFDKNWRISMTTNITEEWIWKENYEFIEELKFYYSPKENNKETILLPVLSKIKEEYYPQSSIVLNKVNRSGIIPDLGWSCLIGITSLNHNYNYILRVKDVVLARSIFGTMYFADEYLEDNEVSKAYIQVCRDQNDNLPSSLNNVSLDIHKLPNLSIELVSSIHEDVPITITFYTIPKKLIQC